MTHGGKMQHRIARGDQRNRPGDFVAGNKLPQFVRDGGKLVRRQRAAGRKKRGEQGFAFLPG